MIDNWLVIELTLPDIDDKFKSFYERCDMFESALKEPISSIAFKVAKRLDEETEYKHKLTKLFKFTVTCESEEI